MARTFAKLATPDGEFEMSRRAADELRMLIELTRRVDLVPNADPPVRESTYDDLAEFLREHTGDDGFLDEDWYRGPPVDELEDARGELEELRDDVDDEDVRDRLDARLEELDDRIADARVAGVEADAFSG